MTTATIATQRAAEVVRVGGALIYLLCKYAVDGTTRVPNSPGHIVAGPFTTLDAAREAHRTALVDTDASVNRCQHARGCPLPHPAGIHHAHGMMGGDCLRYVAYAQPLPPAPEGGLVVSAPLRNPPPPAVCRHWLAPVEAEQRPLWAASAEADGLDLAAWVSGCLQSPLLYRAWRSTPEAQAACERERDASWTAIPRPDCLHRLYLRAHNPKRALEERPTLEGYPPQLAVEHRTYPSYTPDWQPGGGLPRRNGFYSLITASYRGRVWARFRTPQWLEDAAYADRTLPHSRLDPVSDWIDF